MAAHKAQLLLKFAQVAQVAAKEAGRHSGFPQVAVSAWEGLHGLQAPSAHADPPPSGQLPAPPAAHLVAGGAHGHALPAAASLLQPHLHRDVPPVLDQGPAGHAFPGATLPHHFGPAVAWDGVHAHDALQSLPPSGSGLRPPRCVPDAASGVAHTALGGRQLKQQGSGRGGQGQQQGGRRGGRAHSSSSVGLNKQIMTANSTGELLAIVWQHGAGFDFFNISTAIARIPKLLGPHACGGQLDATCKALVDDLAKLMEQQINTFDARGLANSAWALGRLRYAGPSRELPALIAGAAKAKLGEFCAQNIANTLWALVYMHHRSEPLLRAAASAAAAKAQDFKPQELANLVWAYASMEYRDDAMLAAVARRAHSLAEQFNEQELSNLIWGLGKLHYGDRALFDHLLRCVASKLHAFTPQGIANVAWGIATAGHRDEPLFRRLLTKCVRELQANDVQGLANMMWAAGALGVRDDAFMAAAAGECCRRADDLSPQQLANVLWACGTLGWAEPRAVARLGDAVSARSGGFEPQALSNCAWALAKLGVSGAARPQVYDALAAAALPKARAFGAQGCANLLWAFATAGHAHPRLFDAITGQVVHRIDAFNAQNCSVAAWACATARHYSPALCDALLERALGAAPDGAAAAAAAGAGDAPARLAPDSAANLLWALARLGHPVAQGPHAAALRGAAAELMPAMGRQELCNSGWALAAMGLMEERTWAAFCSALGAANGLTSEDLQQAYHVQLLAQAARKARAIEDLPDSIDDVFASPGSDAPPPAPRAASPPDGGARLELPEPLRGLAERCWHAGPAAAPPRSGRMASEVAAALEAAGAGCALGVRTDDGALCADVAVEVDGRRVALELGSESGFASNVPRRALGDAAARARLLRARGWAVVALPPGEWDALPADPAARAAALLRAVDEELGHTEWAAFGPPVSAPPEAVAAARDAAAQASAAARRDALAQAQGEQQRQQELATAELVQALLQQQAAQQQAAQAQAAAIQYMHPVRSLSAEAGGVAPAAAAAVLADCVPGTPAWGQAEFGTSPFSGAGGTGSPLAAAAQQAHSGLASLLYGAAPAVAPAEQLAPAFAAAGDAGAWALAGTLDGGAAARRQAAAAAAAAQGWGNPAFAPRPDEIFAFGWGNGGIWGRP